MKKKRHKEILSIVKEKDITDQKTLIDELGKRGYSVTQATVSRDITLLGLGKAASDDGVNRYVLPERLKDKKLQSQFATVNSITQAMNTVVIKTETSWAQPVCNALDLKDIPLIVGTIAGDDTIFAVTRSVEDAKLLADKLRKLI